ncbi:hypothetical protein LCGC14_1163240 [marine sediment metagenome]|uniref:Uncharacterized protein n=1 Tax=marine sediment metagenome TaxID=412755 RepID=A0A0F9PA85_9ZZZZ
MARRRRTIFFPPKSPRLARAISITSPEQFRKSISRVRKLKGISSTTKKRALVLAKNRAAAQLKRKTLSTGERRQFTAITKIKIPKL